MAKCQYIGDSSPACHSLMLNRAIYGLSLRAHITRPGGNSVPQPPTILIQTISL
jgi:hypothetical protein